MLIPQLIHAGIGDTQMAVRRLRSCSFLLLAQVAGAHFAHRSFRLFESAQLLQPAFITLVMPLHMQCS